MGCIALKGRNANHRTTVACACIPQFIALHWEHVLYQEKNWLRNKSKPLLGGRTKNPASSIFCGIFIGANLLYKHHVYTV